MQPVLIGGEYFPGTDTAYTDDHFLDIIKKSFSTVYHASSTCTMSKEGDRNAVVDSKARVFYVKGLRVVDASAFPFLPPRHPVASVYALVEKIVSNIKGGK